MDFYFCSFLLEEFLVINVLLWRGSHEGLAIYVCLYTYLQVT